MAPARSIWTTATRTRLVGEREQVGGRATGPAARVPTGRSGRSSWNQTCLWVGVYSTPQRAASAAQSWRPRPPSRSGLPMVTAGALEGDLALGVVVGDLDADAVVAAQAQHVGGGARVDDGVGHQFAGEDDGVVDDVGEAPALEGVADEGAGGRHRSSDGLEAGGRARGDHRTPRPVVDVQGSPGRPVAPLVRRTAPSAGVRGLSRRDQSGGHVCGRPSDARSCSCHRPGRRTGAAGQPHARLLTSRAVRMPVCGVSARRVCGRCAKLPNCYGRFGRVKHWAGSCEGPGRLSAFRHGGQQPGCCLVDRAGYAVVTGTVHGSTRAQR